MWSPWGWHALFQREKYIYTNPFLKHCQSLLTFAAAHCECHLKRAHLRFTTYVTPKSCEQSAEQTVMSPLNMHERGITCSGCIGVVDSLHSHYHKLLFIARLAWWWCNVITQSCGTSFSNLHNQNFPQEAIIFEMFPCFVLLQFDSPTWSLEGTKRLSIFISSLDLFWAVIKVHLPLRISIMISLTLVYMAVHRLAGLTCTSLIKSAELWIYSKACMINEGKDLVQYCRLFHNFTTHSFPLTGVGWGGVSWHFPCMVSRQCWDVAAASARPAEVFARSALKAVPCIDNCAFVWCLPTPWHTTIWLHVCHRGGLVACSGQTNTIRAL